MSGADLGPLDEWERRAAQIGPAIRRAFPMTLLDQEPLREMLETASRPLTPRGGLIAAIYARVFPFAWVDSELLEFLKLLRDHDWTEIDWNHHWMVIPILPDVAFVYCLPGILYWIVVDPDATSEAIEGLIEYSLPRTFLRQSTTGCDPHVLDTEQRHVTAEVVRLLHDLSFSDNRRLRKVARDIILHLEGESRDQT